MERHEGERRAHRIDRDRAEPGGHARVLGIHVRAPTEEVAGVAPPHRRRLYFLEQVLRKDDPCESLQSDRVPRIPHDPQRSDHVAHHVVFRDGVPPGEPTGDPGSQQPTFEMLAHAVLAIDDGVIPPPEPGGRLVGLEVVEQPRGFGVLVREGVGAYLVLGRPLGHESLVEQVRILGEDTARGLEDLVRAAAVAVEHDGLRDPEVLAEPAEHSRIGAGPGEDRLLVIPDREEVAMGRREPLQDLVLCRVQILELVHEQVVPPRGDGVGDVPALAEQRRSPRDEVVEVEHVAARQVGRVLPVHRLVPGRQAVVLQPPPGEQGEQSAPALGVDAEAAEHDPLVLLVGHPKAAVESGGVGMLAEDGQAQGVERPPRDLLRALPQRALEPHADLLCRLVGERHGADAGGVEVEEGDQAVHTADQAEGLAGSRPGHDEGGPERGLDRKALVEQRLEVHQTRGSEGAIV